MIGIKDQYFGTEIEMTGITRQRAAEVVAEMFGTEAYYDGTTYGVWSVIDLEGKKWKFMSDGSIYTPVSYTHLRAHETNGKVTGSSTLSATAWRFCK